MTEEEVDEKIAREKEEERESEVAMKDKNGNTIASAKGASGAKKSSLINTKRRSSIYEESGYDEVSGMTTLATNPNPNAF